MILKVSLPKHSQVKSEPIKWSALACGISIKEKSNGSKKRFIGGFDFGVKITLSFTITTMPFAYQIRQLL
jgi:hypothetical protein